MSAVGMQYANGLDQEGRQTDRQGCSRLILLKLVGFGSILLEEIIFDPEMLTYCRTPSHMFTSDPSDPSYVQPTGERHKSNAQQRRDGDTVGHKSKALYCGDRGSEHVTNQTGSDDRMAGETNHTDPISSAELSEWRKKKTCGCCWH